MTIDIIDLEDERYADLSPDGMKLVRAAQLKKNEILRKANEDIEEMFESLIDRHFERSTEFKQFKIFVKNRAAEEIDVLREDLMFQLAYMIDPSQEGGGGGGEESLYRYPDNPDYSLGYSDRFQVVRSYYMSATSDPNARLLAFSNDSLAKSYLGDFYQTLYDLLASYC